MKAPDHVKWGVLAKNPMSATGGSSLNSSDGGFRFNSQEKCVRRDVHEQCGKKARTKLYTKTNSEELLGSKIEKRPRQWLYELDFFANLMARSMDYGMDGGNDMGNRCVKSILVIFSIPQVFGRIDFFNNL